MLLSLLFFSPLIQYPLEGFQFEDDKIRWFCPPILFLKNCLKIRTRIRNIEFIFSKTMR